MCGRTCLTLQPDDFLCACKYNKVNNLSKDKDAIKKECETKSVEIKEEELPEGKADDEMLQPEWRAEFNCGRSYVPSYNIAPTDITPVLVSIDHFRERNENKSGLNETQRRIVVPMLWGMIPFWHKGDYKRHGLTTNNCRLEHLLESKLYAGPFKRGQRCVVCCEGFYEWQTTKTAKSSERAVHLIYMPQKEGIKIYDNKTWKPEDVNLLKMAALFDVWTDENGDKIYSYSVITYESTKIMSWMHHRMPAILETEQQVDDWLDFKRVKGKEALALLRPAENIQWHQVTNIVNNSRNKSEDCNKPIEIVGSKKSLNSSSNEPKKGSLMSWLNVRKRDKKTLNKETDEDDDKESVNSVDSESEIEHQAKRPKYRDFKKSLAKSEQTDNSDNPKI